MHYLQRCVNLLVAKKILFTQIGLSDVLGLQSSLFVVIEQRVDIKCNQCSLCGDPLPSKHAVVCCGKAAKAACHD